MEVDADPAVPPDRGRTQLALTRDSTTIKTLRVKHTRILRGPRG